MSLPESEFTVLRQTIASRGTTRIVLLPVTLLGWAALACQLLFVSDVPLASLFSLAVLVAGFEAIHALHVGVERIGRYVQVYYESREDGPRWETTAMKVGPALPGGGIDPLFTRGLHLRHRHQPDSGAAAFTDARATGRAGRAHVALLVRLVRARGAAARQRAVELESYRASDRNTRRQKRNRTASSPRVTAFPAHDSVRQPAKPSARAATDEVRARSPIH